MLGMTASCAIELVCAGTRSTSCHCARLGVTWLPTQHCRAASCLSSTRQTDQVRVRRFFVRCCTKDRSQGHEGPRFRVSQNERPVARRLRRRSLHMIRIDLSCGLKADRRLLPADTVNLSALSARRSCLPATPGHSSPCSSQQVASCELGTNFSNLPSPDVPSLIWTCTSGPRRPSLQLRIKQHRKFIVTVQDLVRRNYHDHHPGREVLSAGRCRHFVELPYTAP